MCPSALSSATGASRAPGCGARCRSRSPASSSVMDDTGQSKLVDLFERGLRLPAAERKAFLDDVCAGNEALRQELASLLHASDSASGYFDALAEQVITPAYSAIASGGAKRDPLPELRAALGQTYRIERELKGGAMSRVFLAEDLKLGRKIGRRLLPTGMGASARSASAARSRWPRSCSTRT